MASIEPALSQAMLPFFHRHTVAMSARFFCLAHIFAFAAFSPARALDLPATLIFDKGPNRYAGEVLEITRGRGATIGWYVQAQQAGEVRVLAEYTCERPLNQAYQLSFDGQDVFWDVEPTGKKKEWRRAELGRFPIRAGLPVLVLLVPPSGTKYEHPVRFQKLIIEGAENLGLALASTPPEPPAPDATPGFGQKLAALHPALRVQDLRDEGRTLRVSGMALRGEDELLFCTWDGDLFSLDLKARLTEAPPPLRHLMRGLSEPMGLAVLGQRIFVTEKNEVTELLDEDGDGLPETLRCVSHDWPCSMDYHEYLFGAVVKGEHIYFSSSVGMARRGMDNYQAPLRGSLVKVHLETGHTEILAGGLRTPDGLGLGADGSLLVTDNQGEWLPANKLIRIQEGAFYQFRSTPPRHPLDRSQADSPAVWLPQGEIAASPTQPFTAPSSWGPYAGQVIFGDATFGGLQRAFLEEVDGISQGAVFPFSQGLRHLLHRFALGPDGVLWAGGIARGKDPEFIHRVSGLTRIEFTGQPVFDLLAARLRSNGIEIEFTQPLAEGAGWDPEAYHAAQWGYQATQTYGGQKVRPRLAEVRNATVSEDRRRVFLELPGLVAGEVLHLRLPQTLPSESGLPLWSGELWYTVNRLPTAHLGSIRPAPRPLTPPAQPWFRYSEGNEGKTLFQNFCSACHSLEDTKLAGPALRGITGSQRRVRDPATGAVSEIEATAEYLRQSILEPNALVVEGYPENLMPPIGAILTSRQIDALVEYIVQATSAKK